MQDAVWDMAMKESPVLMRVKALIRALDNALLASNGGADQEAFDDAMMLSGILYEIVCEEGTKDAGQEKVQSRD